MRLTRAERLSTGRLAAVGVHVLTALGAVVALLAARALIAADWQAMFLWLGVSFLIDGVDGPLARFFSVKKKIPSFSGERLDWIIDYLSFVFIPVVALVEAGFLPGISGLVLASLILLSSLYHFCDMGNKSDDGCFVGFPAIWNIVAFYCFALALPPLVVGVMVVVLVIATFVPLKWVHPVRSRWARPITALVTALWAVVAVFVTINGFPAPAWAQVVLVACALYGIGLSLSYGMAR